MAVPFADVFSDDSPPSVLLSRMDTLVLRYEFSVPVRDVDVGHCQSASAELCQPYFDDGSLPSDDVRFLEFRPRKTVNQTGALFWLASDRHLVCSFNAFFLSRWGHSHALELADLFVAFLRWGRADITVTGVVSQAHLCVDLQPMPGLSQPLLDAVVGTRLRSNSPMRLDQQVRGIVYGRALGLQAAIYDKGDCARRPEYAWLLHEWEQSGLYRPGRRIWRIEFRFRNAESIARKKCPVEPVRFLTDLPSIWRRLCSSVLWLRRPTEGREKSWPRLRWWSEVVSSVPWEGTGLSVPGPDRLRDPEALLRQMCGLLGSVIHLHTGEDREKARAVSSIPLRRFIERMIGESLGRVRGETGGPETGPC